MYWIIELVLVMVALELGNYWLLRGKTGSLRLIIMSMLLAIAISFPFIIPAKYKFIRLVVALIALVKLFKVMDMAFQHMPDLEMVKSFPRYVVWTSIGPDTKWPKDREACFDACKKGAIRLLRGTVKFAAVAVFLSLSTAFPQIHNYYWLKMLWLAYFTYFFLTGIVDTATAIFMLMGIFVEETFHAPLLARSPRDFWSRRWNRFFRAAAHRNIFVPLDGKNRPLPAVIAVSLYSVAIHEYLILAAIGTKMLGYMSAFFMLHCLVTIIQVKFEQRTGKKEVLPAPLAILLHNLWMLATIPLFLEPALSISAIHQLHLW